MISDQPAASLIPPGMLGHDAGRRWPSMPRDAALAALREAGIQPGTTLAVSIQPLLRDRTALLLAASPKVRGLVLRGTKPYLNYGAVGVAVAERVAEARRATGGTIHVPMTSGITSLDLQQRSTAELGEVLPSIFQTLTAEKVHPVLAGPYAAVARELSNAFGSQGVAVRPVTTNMLEFLQAHRGGTADVCIGRWAADYTDPGSFASIFHSQTGFLGRVCSSPESDRLIARARTESVPALRHALCRELEDMLAGDAIILPMFHEQAYRIARPEVDGLTLGLGTPTVSMEELRIVPPGQVT